MSLTVGTSKTQKIDQALSSGNSNILQQVGFQFDPMWFISAVEQYSSAKTSKQKKLVVNNFMNQAATKVINKGADFLMKGAKELLTGWITKAADATKNVNESAKNIETAEQREKQLKQVNDQKVRELLEKVNTDITEIEGLTAKLQELGLTITSEIEEKLNEKKEVIETNAEILNNPESSQEEKENALKLIQTVDNEIVELVASFAGFITQITEISTNVAEKTTDIAANTQEATQVTVNSLNEIKNVQAEVTKEGAVNVNIAKEGAKDEAKGIELQAKAAVETGASVFTFGLSGISAATDQEKAIQYLTAAKTELFGSGKNLSALGVTLGSMSGDIAKIGSDIQAIGYFETQASLQIGKYNTMALSAIDSIGSWKSTLTTSTEELTTAVTDYADAQGIDISNKFVANEVNQSWAAQRRTDDNNMRTADDEVKFTYNTESLKIEKMSFGV